MNGWAFEIQGLCKSFSAGFDLQIGELKIEAGRIYAVLGPNGAGKTTLLRLLAGLDAPDRGSIRFHGREVRRGEKGLEVRRRMVLMSQKPALFRGTVLRNVLYGLKVRGVPQAEALKRANEALSAVGLESLGGREANGLSGGEAQRVAMARALCLDVDALLLDEPTAHIDRASIATIESCLTQLNTNKGVTILFTTHEEEQARRLTSTFLHLREGRLVT